MKMVMEKATNHLEIGSMEYHPETTRALIENKLRKKFHKKQIKRKILQKKNLKFSKRSMILSM